eukprot:scaffold2421_cov390-Prasinococcus_capsulatus_cf.AAC.16
MPSSSTLPHTDTPLLALPLATLGARPTHENCSADCSFQGTSPHRYIGEAVRGRLAGSIGATAVAPTRRKEGRLRRRRAAVCRGERGTARQSARAPCR